jgi:hypothetical protein
LTGGVLTIPARNRAGTERINARGQGGGTIGIEECTLSRLAHIKAGVPKAKIVDGGDIGADALVKDPTKSALRRAAYFADYKEAAGRAYIEANGSVQKMKSLRPRQMRSPIGWSRS